MLQTQDALFHRETPFAEDTRRVDQDETRPRPSYAMSLMGVFWVCLPGLDRQQMLQRSKDKVIDRPGPVPAALRGRTFRCHMAPHKNLCQET